MLYLFKEANKWFMTCFSMTFDKIGSTEIGQLFEGSDF